MDNFKQQIATEFDQYQSLSANKERQSFWSNVEKRVDEMTPDQRLTAQTDVRENVKQILHRMEAISQQLTITENA